MPNRLSSETSPYLRQHAHNPVEWQPWDDAALREARDRDCPILLSVGYSACHWCHVMERESFEDAAVAVQMNAGFVCIKVDREERPDLDDLYMKATQALNRGRGGWPMTVFLTPEGRPFFAGTYFPPRPAHGMPSFPQVLGHVGRLWTQHRAEMEQLGQELTEHVRKSGNLPAGQAAAGDWLGPVVEACAEDIDPENGGFGGAPKFPPHGQLAALLAAAGGGDRQAAAMLRGTLDGMAKGGVYDHVAGGFCRYSVDARWCIPHFEKMLYDNAQLAPIYVQAGLLLGEPRWLRIARETLQWGMREMRVPVGAGSGFASSLDADAEGEEGRYHVWTPEELREGLGIFDGMRAGMLLGVERDARGEGNFEHGRSAIRMESPLEALSEADQALIGRAFAFLRERRAARVAPGRDGKVLAAWNGMWIGALCQGATAMWESHPDEAAGWLAAAGEAADTVWTELRVGGRLRRSWLDHAGGPAFAEDYAHLLAGLIALHQACVLTGAPRSAGQRWLARAEEVAAEMLRLFWDGQGALYQTGSDVPQLIARSRPLISGSEPAANAVAAGALIRLAAITGDDLWRDRAEQILGCYRALLERAPRALGIEAVAGEALRLQRQIGLAGEAAALRRALRGASLPFAVVADDPALPWMEGKAVPEGSPGAAWVCERGTCLMPTDDPAELLRQVSERPAADPSGLRLRAPELPTDPARWLGGLPQTLAALRGRVVVLDFWTLCCINCIHVLPELQALEEQLAGEPLTVIGVHSAKFDYEKEPAAVEAARLRLGIAHPVVLDPAHELWQQYGVRAWPSVIVLDAAGRIAWQRSGEVSVKELRAVCERLIAEIGSGGAERAEERGTAHEITSGADSAGEGGAGLAGLRFPEKIHVWGLQSPAPVLHLDGPHMVYVADTGNHRLLVCDVGWERGEPGQSTEGAEGEARWPVLLVRRIYGDGTAGFADGAAPRFRQPRGIWRLDQALYVADSGNHAIRRVDLETHEVTTLAGTGTLGRGGADGGADGGDGAGAALRSPWDIVASPDGDGGEVLFIAMAGAHQLWVISEGRMGVLAGSGRENHADGPSLEATLAQPSGLALGGRWLFFVDAETSSVRLLDLAEHKVGTVCGQSLFDWGDVDGGPEAARLQHPTGIALGDGELLIADSYNHKVKAIHLERMTVETVAGGPGLLHAPSGLAVLAEHILVADTDAHRIVAVRREDGAMRAVRLRF